MGYKISRGTPIGVVSKTVSSLSGGMFGSGNDIAIPGDQMARLSISMTKEQRESYVEDMKWIAQFPQYVVWDADSSSLYYIGEIFSGSGCVRKALELDVAREGSGHSGLAEVIGYSDVSPLWIADQKQKGHLFAFRPSCGDSDLVQVL